MGAVGSPRALSRRPSAYHQSWGVYSCPWNSVRDTRVVTDRDELRRLVRHYRTFNNRWGGSACNIGVMSAPFMRAALVVELYPSGVTGAALGGTGVGLPKPWWHAGRPVPGVAGSVAHLGHLGRTNPPFRGRSPRRSCGTSLLAETSRDTYRRARPRRVGTLHVGDADCACM